MVALIVFLFLVAIFLLWRWWGQRARDESYGKAEETYQRVLAEGALGVELKRMRDSEQRPSQLASVAARLTRLGLFRSQSSRDVLFWVDRELRLAGRPYGWTATEAISALLVFWLCALLAVIFAAQILQVPTLLLVVIAAVLIAYPILKVRQIKRTRQEQARLELPSFINDLVMNLSGGVTTIDDALGRLVSSDDEYVRGRVLVREFGQAWNEYRHGGRDREEALRDAADRLGIQGVNNFVDAIIQGLRTGAPIRLTLISQSQQIQAIFREDMRAYIGKKESSFVISLVFILAGLLILTGVPIFLELFSTFSA